MARQAQAEMVMGTWLEHKAVTTRTEYQAGLSYFLKWAGFASLACLLGYLEQSSQETSRQLSVDYRTYLLSTNLSSATINLRFTTLHSLASVIKKKTGLQFEVVAVRVKRHGVRDTRGPVPQVIEQILTQLEQNHSQKGQRDLAIFRLLYDLGLRCGEVIRLDLNDIDISQKTIMVQGKGHRSKSPVKMPTQVVVALSSWVTQRGSMQGPLFSTMTRDPKQNGNRLTPVGLRHLVSRIGLKFGEKIRPHALRHSIITQKLDKGAPFRDILSFTRHKTPSGVFVYYDTISQFGSTQ